MRVFVFGVDGLTFRVLNPMIEQGLLLNFQRVRDGGAQGVLKSTIPPLTPPAWMSISTGLSPAKHGVYDFWDFERTESGLRPHLLTHRKGGKAIWNLLSDFGKQVIVANVPMTYPPEPVNGIMLSGYMTPSMKADVTYPTSFKDELLQIVPAYQIDLNPATSAGQIGDSLAETLKMTRERIAMLRLLLDKQWDFFFIVFTGADRIQHLCWDQIMALHPQAVAYYQMLDEALGMVLGSLNDDDMLLIVSDHGFQGARRKFYINEYLHRQGLLQMKKGSNHYKTELVGFVKELIRSLKLQRLALLLQRQLYRSGVFTTTTEHHAIETPDVDWTKTRAWIPSSSLALANCVDIFLADSLTEEEISTLTNALRNIHDPDTGQPLAVEIHREDAFGIGPFAPRERHLILLSGENITIQVKPGPRTLWNTWDITNGIHHPDGVLYLYGANVMSGATIAPSHVYDVVPTVLSYLGLPLPHELDGRIISEAFEQSLPIKVATQGDSIAMQKLKKLAVQEG